MGGSLSYVIIRMKQSTSVFSAENAEVYTEAKNEACFALLAFLIIESLHIRISALFLGKDGTELAYRVFGELK